MPERLDIQPAIPRITGTFLDGIEADIPSQNWGPAEWARQFDVLAPMGMDTVTIIRVGWKELAMYDSRVMRADVSDPEDRVALFLGEAQRTGMKLYIPFSMWESARRLFDRYMEAIGDGRGCGRG